MRSERGFTFIGLLVAVAVMGLLLTLVARVWSTAERRERETQLLWVGSQYRLAIASYYNHGNRFPETLDELLTDNRFPVPLRHLRQLYPDPMTGKPDWTLIMTPADGQRIMGVASSSNAVPIKRKNFDSDDAAFEDLDCYCLWQFMVKPRYYRGAVPAAGTGSSTDNQGSSSPPAPANPGDFNPGQLSPLPGGPQPAPGTVLPHSLDPVSTH